MEMEVEASVVGDGGCSREVLKGGFTQGWREEEVQKSCVRPSKKE
jgi:hypothetical protein